MTKKYQILKKSKKHLTLIFKFVILVSRCLKKQQISKQNKEIYLTSRKEMSNQEEK